MITMSIIIILVLLLVIQRNNNNFNKEYKKKYEEFIRENTTTKSNPQKNEQNLSKYKTNNYIMTQTELKFYKELKKVTDKLNLTIFSQVNMERLINVIDNNTTDRNKIKSRSIDFVITRNDNCKVICCIELDDYTHNKEKVKIIDNFKNDLFKKVNIPLHRIKVNNYYNSNEIENILKEDL